MYLGKAVGSELVAGKTVQSSVGDRVRKRGQWIAKEPPSAGSKTGQLIRWEASIEMSTFSNKILRPGPLKTWTLKNLDP